ncbi:sporulation protein YjcZ [Paenibacillus athensensis]|nr:sporulation protein YjcZ [Paenibacillus athensensis]MCD1259936.1 sporulation protein YjcZ [Paenibacillus athensensis]
MSYAAGCAPVGGLWTTTGTILVLYVLLVIILRTFY